MIILDTNVLSELTKPEPEERVIEWILQCDVADLYTTVISEFEMLYGVWALPDGNRKKQLDNAVTNIFETRFFERVLPFDRPAAAFACKIKHACLTRGFNIKSEDLMIAAITAQHDAILATRNIRDFEPCGIDLFNPWQPA